MARDVYSTRFLAGENFSSPLEYTVPTGYRAVLRCWTYHHLSEPSGGTLALTLGGIAQVMYIEVNADQSIDGVTDLRVVVNEGELVIIAADLGNWDSTLSGYLLTLP